MEPEHFEYAAAVADADCQNDSERQFKHIEVGLRKWELRRAQILQDEQRLRESRVASLNKMESTGAREQLRLDAMFLEQAVKRLDTKKMAAEIEVAAQAVDATLPVPGERDAGPLAKWRLGKKGRLMLVVPTATKPMSMFEPSFWSAYDPRSFPYGDGVFGVERRVAMSFEEWGRMLMEREELDYDSVFDDSGAVAVASGGDGSQAERAELVGSVGAAGGGGGGEGGGAEAKKSAVGGGEGEALFEYCADGSGPVPGLAGEVRVDEDGDVANEF